MGAFDINGFNEDARFPTNIPEFKTNLMDLAKRTVELSERLLKCISLTLGRPEDFFTNLHSRVFGGKNASALRTLYYPSIEGIPPDGHVRWFLSLYIDNKHCFNIAPIIN